MTEIEQLAADSGLTIVARGTQYARLMLGDKKLTAFRGVGWEPAARAFIDGWLQSQKEHDLVRIDGCVEVAGHHIKYCWVVPATIAAAFGADTDQCAIEHVGGELRRGATRGLMGSHEHDRRWVTIVHGWWWSGDEEEVLQEKESAALQTMSAATREYLEELNRVCKIINEAYDATTAAGEKCFLEHEGASMGRIISRSECRYQWVAVHLSEVGRKRTIRLAPKVVGGSGAGKYNVITFGAVCGMVHTLPPSPHGRTEIVVPHYPGIVGDEDLPNTPKK